MNSVAPLATCVPVVVPPDRTYSVSPALRVKPSSVALWNSRSAPDRITTPVEIIRPPGCTVASLIVPPGCSTTMPPLSTMVPLATPAEKHELDGAVADRAAVGAATEVDRLGRTAGQGGGACGAAVQQGVEAAAAHLGADRSAAVGHGQVAQAVHHGAACDTVEQHRFLATVEDGGICGAGYLQQPGATHSCSAGGPASRDRLDPTGFDGGRSDRPVDRLGAPSFDRRCGGAAVDDLAAALTDRRARARAVNRERPGDRRRNDRARQTIPSQSRRTPPRSRWRCR